MAGPLANFLIAFIFGVTKNYILIIYINLILGILNLFPIYPLDGGRIVKQILILLLGRRKALKYTNTISNIILGIIVLESFIFCCITKSIMLLIAIGYLIYIRIQEDKVYRTKENVYKLLEELK